MKEGPICLVAIVNKQERQIPLSFRQARANVMIEFVWLFVDLPDIFLADPNVARFVRFSIRRFISGLRVAEKCDLSFRFLQTSCLPARVAREIWSGALCFYASTVSERKISP